MAQAEIREVLPVAKDKLWEAIVRYEDYPKFVDGCTRVKVERKATGHARVTYNVSMMKDVTYTLDHKEDKEKGTVEWTLVDSDTFKKNTGRWSRQDRGSVQARGGVQDPRPWIHSQRAGEEELARDGQEL
jgi:ribosome-associated toxin RatA of RatAB toxin-antitoxin module